MKDSTKRYLAAGGGALAGTIAGWMLGAAIETHVLDANPPSDTGDPGLNTALSATRALSVQNAAKNSGLVGGALGAVIGVVAVG